MLTVQEWKKKLRRNFDDGDAATLEYAADMFSLMIDGNHLRPPKECIELRDFSNKLLTLLKLKNNDLHYEEFSLCSTDDADSVRE